MGDEGAWGNNNSERRAGEERRGNKGSLGIRMMDRGLRGWLLFFSLEKRHTGEETVFTKMW